MENTSANIDLIRSHMDTIILRTLQNDDKYGLEMLNEIRNLSDELYSIKQPTLYSSLKRLETQGLILSYPGEETKGANRTYYRLTDEGRKYLEADQKQWEFSRTIINKLLSDKDFDKETSEMPFDPADFRPLTKRTKKETEEKVVIKYVEVEKPVYIDRKTGEKIDGYSPEADKNTDNTDSEESFDNMENNFAVYNNSNEDNENIEDTSANYIIENETPKLVTTTNNQEISNIQTESFEEYKPLNEDINEEYNNYHISSTQYTEENEDFDYTSPLDNYFISNVPLETQEEKPTHIKIDHNNYIDDNVDYVGLIEGMLKNKKATEENNLEEKSNFLTEYQEVTMNELQKNLANKDIKLRPYHKSNTVKFYSGKFFYSNKMLRDWSYIMYAIFALFILLSWSLGKDTGIQWTYSLGFGLAGLILPISCTAMWFKSPLRKKRNSITLNNAMLSSIILMIALVVVILIVAFFIVQIDASKSIEYVPAIVIPTCSLVLLPLSVVIYALLFKVKTYHLR